jgi:hypothetical protein
MPCSSRACRLENELTDGSLGTIFRFWPLSLRQSRASLTRSRRGDLSRTHQFPQMVGGGWLSASSRFGRSLWSLIGHLGECAGRDPKDKDPDAPHAECDARHTHPSAVPPPVFTRAAGTPRNKRPIKLTPAYTASGCSEWSPASRFPMLRQGVPFPPPRAGKSSAPA